MDTVSRDGGFLRRTMAEVRGVDKYTDMILAMKIRRYTSVSYSVRLRRGIFFAFFRFLRNIGEKDGGDGGRLYGAGAGFGSFAPLGKIRHRISIAVCPHLK